MSGSYLNPPFGFLNESKTDRLGLKLKKLLEGKKGTYFIIYPSIVDYVLLESSRSICCVGLHVTRMLVS